MKSFPLHLSALDDYNILVWFVPCGAGVFDHSHNVHPINNLTEYNMFAIQKWSCSCCDEELAAICIRPRILGVVNCR